MPSGDGKKRLLKLAEEIQKLREVRQELQKTSELAESYEPVRHTDSRKAEWSLFSSSGGQNGAGGGGQDNGDL